MAKNDEIQYLNNFEDKKIKDQHMDFLVDYFQIHTIEEANEFEKILLLYNDNKLFLPENMVDMSEKFFNVKTKEGLVVPFKLRNYQQDYVEHMIDQYKTRGFNKVLAPKGRQIGYSTTSSMYILWVYMLCMQDSSLPHVLMSESPDVMEEILCKRRLAFSTFAKKFLLLTQLGLVINTNPHRMNIKVDREFFTTNAVQSFSTFWGVEHIYKTFSEQSNRENGISGMTIKGMQITEAGRFTLEQVRPSMNAISGNKDTYVIVESTMEGKKGVMYSLLKDTGVLEIHEYNRDFRFFPSQKFVNGVRDPETSKTDYMVHFSTNLHDDTFVMEPPSPDWKAPDSVIAYLENGGYYLGKNLTLQQLYKFTSEFGISSKADLSRSMNDYPLTLHDAVFSQDVDTKLFSQESIDYLFETGELLQIAPLADHYGLKDVFIIGVDLGFGRDLTVYTALHGVYEPGAKVIYANILEVKEVRAHEINSNKDTTCFEDLSRSFVENVKELCIRHQKFPKAIFIDTSQADGQILRNSWAKRLEGEEISIGIDADVYKRIGKVQPAKHVFTQNIVVDAPFGSRKHNKFSQAEDDGFFPSGNHRNDMFNRLKKYLDNKTLRLSSSVRECFALRRQMEVIEYQEHHDKGITLIAKEKIKKKLRCSPDHLDSLVLCFWSLKPYQKNEGNNSRFVSISTGMRSG